VKKGRAIYRKSKQKRNSRAQFSPISEEMKEWSAMLGSELNSWPDITTRSMFGFLFYYRKGKVFAALPQTRGFSGPSSLIFKFNSMPPALLKRAQGDSRMDSNTRVPGKGWFPFELRSQADVRDALFWLKHSCEAAAK
jgi:hypothetical protein